jgi:hypothetical protein
VALDLAALGVDAPQHHRPRARRTVEPDGRKRRNMKAVAPVDDATAEFVPTGAENLLQAPVHRDQYTESGK